MKKLSGILFVVIALGFGVALGLFWKEPTKIRNAESRPRIKQSIPTGTPLMQVARESVGRPQAEVVPSDEPCIQFFEQIETNPLNTIIADMKDGKLVVPGSCEGRVAGLKPLWDRIIATCKTAVSNECETSMLVFRAARLTDYYKNLELSAQPFEAVVQKLFSILGQNQVTTPEGIKNFREVAQELLSRDPGSKGASKAEVLSYMIEKAMSTEGAPGMDPWDQAKDVEFIDSLARARELNPEDQQIYEIELLNDLFPVTPEKLAEIEQSAQSEPDDSLLNYMSACAAWKMRQTDRAKYYFQKAASLNPTDTRFVESWKQSQSAAPGAAICTFQAGLNPDSF